MKFAAEHTGISLEDGVFDDIDDIDTQALLSTPPAIDISTDIDTPRYPHTPASTVPIFNFATYYNTAYILLIMIFMMWIYRRLVHVIGNSTEVI